jgi:hypothetical protein
MGLFLLFSHLKESFADESQEKIQNFGTHLNRGGPVYTRSKVIEFCYFDPSTFSSVNIKLSYSAITQRKSIQIQQLRQEAPASNCWSMEPIFLGRWIISIGI